MSSTVTEALLIFAQNPRLTSARILGVRRALAPSPPYTTPGPRVGARAGNLYSASSPLASANCSDVEINYDGLSPPHTIDLINASTSLLPVGSSFFDSLAPSSNFNVSVIKQLGVRNYTMGYVYWTIGDEAPVGSRVAWRITDSTGAVGFSEVRTVYAASEASKNACAA